jgi:hypothetical protein
MDRRSYPKIVSNTSWFYPGQQNFQEGTLFCHAREKHAVFTLTRVPGWWAALESNQ